MLLYFCDQLVGKNQGILTPKLERVKKRIVSLMMSQVLLTIETLLWSFMSKFEHCTAQCTNIAGGTSCKCVFELHSHDLLQLMHHRSLVQQAFADQRLFWRGEPE